MTLLAFWSLDLGGDVLVLVFTQPILMVAPAGVMLVVALLIGCNRDQKGVMILSAALSNHGFTLGAYLCYAILEPADDAIAYGIAYVISMQLGMVLIFYPIAKHFGPEDSGSLRKLIVGSFLTVRAMPMYTALFGLGLNLGGVAYPRAFIHEFYLLDVLIFLGAAGANFGIGLRFRFGDSFSIWKLHGGLALVQFVVHPLLAWGLVGLYGVMGITMGPLVRDVILVESFIPVALNAVIVSNLFHLDARTASSLWLWNTILFCVGPLWLVLYWFA